MVARPPRMNLLGASVQFYADAKIVGYVPKEMFWPRPKVESAIIKLIPKEKPASETASAFFSAVKAGFSQPRKQLLGNLSKKLNLPRDELLKIFQDFNIPAAARAENLDLNQWLKLAAKLIHK